MASRLFRVSLALANTQSKSIFQAKLKPLCVPKRNCCFTDSGAVLPKPEVTRLGVMRALGTALPFLLLGSYISMEFAALLEEHDLFVPDDDDDD